MNKTAGSVQSGGRDVALVRALVTLTLEKRFDAITVQQVLDRAEVGRTTFYARYRGKDDLLVRSFRHLRPASSSSAARSPGGCPMVSPFGPAGMRGP